jgi:hypothetical protein
VLELSLNGKSIKNQWDFWVYADDQKFDPGNVIITSRWDKQIIDQLEKGATVLFSPPAILLKEKTAGRFSPVFWNRLWFNFQRNHTLGLWSIRIILLLTISHRVSCQLAVV